jgi:antitoxin (DNA-binding transcriptional repressor) of toxin-antitoxin stability system
MRAIGVREFRDQASTLLASGETLVIERHGETIGFYVPVVAVDRRRGLEALDRLNLSVKTVLDLAEIDEDELVAELSKPTPRARPASNRRPAR